MSKKSILITGANGFTGKHACEYFLNEGYKVYGLIREGNSNQNIEVKEEVKENLETIICDMTEFNHLSVLIKMIKPDYVLHTAGKNSVVESWKHPAYYVKANILATVFLLESIREAHLFSTKTLVIGSTLEYNLNTNTPNHPYGLTKTFQSLVAKSWNHLFHLPIIIAKPTNLIGPGPSTGICSMIGEKVAKIRNQMETDPIEIRNLNDERDYLDIRDAIRAYDRIFQKGKIGETYTIGTGQFRTLKEVITTFEKYIDVKLPISFPEGISFKSSERNNNHESKDKEKENNFQYKREIEKIRQLGWKPNYTFDSSIKDIIDYFCPMENRNEEK